VCFKPKLISERVLAAETFNQEEQVMNAQNLTKSRQTKSGLRNRVWRSERVSAELCTSATAGTGY
jgi:hypothetical protein